MQVPATDGLQFALRSSDWARAVGRRCRIHAWSAKDLAALNTELAAKNLKPVLVMTRAEWDGGRASGQ